MATLATVLSNAAYINQNDEIIAVMGPTGSGKSHLIDCLTQNTGTRWSGDSLRSETQQVRAVRVTNTRFWKNPIVLIDTPGFDDQSRSDLEVLTIIAEWLNQTYTKQLTLTGILYLHRITDNRMPESPRRNLRMFGKICGSSFAKRVLFVTTMWDKRPERGVERETELKEKYLKPMLDLGAETARFENEYVSAWTCVCRLLTKGDDTRAALIQEEMVDLGMNLNETKAARILQAQLQEVLSDHKRTVEAFLKQAERGDDPNMVEELQKTRIRLEQELEGLKVPLPRRILLFLFKRSKGRGVDLAGSKSRHS